jgi:UDPglucose 6-dehydrogenase
MLFEIYRKIYNRRAEQLVEGLPTSEFYRIMSIESAELTKVAYNTFITSKICIVNTLMEICHNIPGANIDDVTGALKNANKRLISTAYLTGGLGDGGGCHPRDNIAMSWLAKNINLSYDWFENLMISREKQAEFLADLIMKEYMRNAIVIILGYEFKPETSLITGSHALLVKEIVEENGIKCELLAKEQAHELKPRCGRKLIIFIGCKHESFKDLEFPVGSVILDPFRYITDKPGCKVIRIGE